MPAQPSISFLKDVHACVEAVCSTHWDKEGPYGLFWQVKKPLFLVPTSSGQKCLLHQSPFAHYWNTIVLSSELFLFFPFLSLTC